MALSDHDPPALLRPRRRDPPPPASPLQPLLDGGERPADRLQRRRLAGGRSADQRLPQDERLGPGLSSQKTRTPAPPKPRDRRQQCLHDIVGRGVGAQGGIAHPLAPGLGQDIEGEGREAGTAVLQKARVELGPIPLMVRRKDGLPGRMKAQWVDARDVHACRRFDLGMLPNSSRVSS